MNKFTALTIILTASILTACGDPKEANDSNFKVAVQQYLDKRFPLCAVHDLKFPTEPITTSFHNRIGIYDDLVKLGLMSKKEVQVPVMFQPGKTQPAPVYDLTAEGKKYYVAADENTIGKLPGLCGGKAKVNEITNFTQPSDMFGHTISEVKFTYTVSEIPDWMKIKPIVESDVTMNKIMKTNGESVEGKVLLVLTGKGWMEESVYNTKK